MTPSEQGSITPYLTCRGAAEAIDFYVRIYGAVEVGDRYIDQADGRMGHAEAGEDTVTLYVQVPDLPVAMHRVTDLGGTVLTSATYESGPNARCVDDQGTLLELFQPNPGYERS